ncbi:protein-disulfide reductase DsbD [Parasulfuritortus cantonensis]|uniref:Thiol:disulfide interchange protein DsbD n=1 Tax=Parasulfuritortus cantonensis TaxID=2528202 RepID=A0A4V2NWF2_9PROT|nr:protein-disulfide reductase DsbD [Parasulfuritortus cantonensis]TCJ17102.1 protein-disulfide reductase DsbD [Parasulfuritortus cantonensis]
MIRIALLALLVLASPWLKAAEDDLLEPEKAFLFSAAMVDDKTVEARFKVADGYYLYRSKLKFAAEAAQLGQAQFPAGKIKEDEFFGRVEIYPGDFRVRIPLAKATPGKSFTLKAEYQGCAAVGVCYPPLDSTITLNVPATAAAAAKAEPSGLPAAAQDPGLIQRLKQMSGGYPGSQANADFLPPDEAFQLRLAPGPDGTLRASFTIAPGHYLYRDKIKLALQAPAGVNLAAPQLPAAEEKDDPNFGRMYIYHHSFTAAAKLNGLPAGGATLVVNASYQGCSEKGICYPPIDKTITLPVMPSAGASPEPAAEPAAQAPAPAAAQTGPAAPAADAATAPAASETDKVAALLQGGNFWLVVVSFFGFGLLLALTPCVFPMIPILSGIIVGQGHQVTKRKGFMLSVAYVLGMAITYALAGVAAGMSGTLISNALQNPWALGTGAAIFVALAFSMFGFYDLQLPSFLQSRFTEASNRIKGGNMVGVFVMGALSALIVGPCVAAPLAGALLYISQTSNVVLGGISLFSLALGMGVPLLLVGLSAGALLPRAGGWMEAVKKFFGVLLLAVAIWLVAPLLSELVQMLAWAALLIISGVYLRAVDPLVPHAGGWQRFWKGVGIITLVAGMALLLGALGGGRDLLQPLSVYKGGVAGAAQPAAALTFKRVASTAELDQAVQAAQGRYVMLDFYADWCTSCKEMEHLTFADPRVQARLKDAVLLQADVTGNRAEDKALLKRFSLFGPPGIIFFDQNGREVAYRVVGYEPPEKFLASLDKAAP